ncbi:TetR family transcriptional regulator [Rubellimicrobium roseum]|uniref:TetR family transcriptional regulator n=2 Tax=Rubellimicrobium roseum TaxID=687525 RepID=A0A5C4ND73_9RHOB|nr:TetR family transcriptional regulator [Rubellimicrobium roseum]
MPEPAGAARRRHAAGEDPAKRDQILEGARQVFLEQGFDAASMNDICRAAGVSKGTLYVYFEGKEDLYVSLVERERNRLFGEVDLLLEQDLPLAEKLFLYGRRIAELMCSDRVVRAQRIIIGTSERMPELGARFYDGGMERAQGRLRRLFAAEAAAGRLVVPDVALAGHQFLELCMAGLLRPRLFGKAPEPPAPEALDRAAHGAVAVFLAAYSVSG